MISRSDVTMTTKCLIAMATIKKIDKDRTISEFSHDFQLCVLVL